MLGLNCKIAVIIWGFFLAPWPSLVTLSRSEGSLSMAFSCHPERSEGSRSLGTEMLRCGSA